MLQVEKFSTFKGDVGKRSLFCLRSFVKFGYTCQGGMWDFLIGKAKTMQSQNIDVSQQQGILETMKEKVNLGSLVEKVQDSQGLFVNGLLFGVIGFLCGYLIKRYINAVITLILVSTGLFVLQQFELLTVTIHWTTLYELLGVTQVAKLLDDNIAPFVFELAKANVLLVISWIVGFLMGIKVG